MLLFCSSESKRHHTFFVWIFIFSVSVFKSVCNEKFQSHRRMFTLFVGVYFVFCAWKTLKSYYVVSCMLVLLLLLFAPLNVVENINFAIFLRNTYRPFISLHRLGSSCSNSKKKHLIITKFYLSVFIPSAHCCRCTNIIYSVFALNFSLIHVYFFLIKG